MTGSRHHAFGGLDPAAFAEAREIARRELRATLIAVPLIMAGFMVIALTAAVLAP